MWKIQSISFSIYSQKEIGGGIHGSQIERVEIKNPTWEELKDFIEKLDGDKLDTLNLDGPKNETMIISGGHDQFVASVISDDTGSFTLLGGDLSDDKITISCGGVMTNLSKQFICTKSAITQAAEYYYRNGTCDPRLDWNDF